MYYYYYVFDDFPKISDHFPKISEDFPKSRRLDRRFRRFSKITEDFRGGIDDVSIISNTSEYFLRDNVMDVATNMFFHV